MDQRVREDWLAGECRLSGSSSRLCGAIHKSSGFAFVSVFTPTLLISYLVEKLLNQKEEEQKTIPMSHFDWFAIYARF